MKFSKYVFASDYSSGFPDCYGTQQQSSSQMGVPFESTGNRSHSYLQNLWPGNSSSTIVGRIGSTSAFYATERFMGLSQYDHHQLPKNAYREILSFQQPGNGLLEDSPTQSESDFILNSNGALSSVMMKSQTHDNRCVNYEGPCRNPFSNLSENEQILLLKRKLLGSPDSSDRINLSVPGDANRDFGVSENLYGSDFSHLRPSGTLPTCISKNSGNSASCVTVSSSKTRIRWTQDLHDRFVECINQLGGSEKATPKAILKLMDTDGLTIFHVKSHLQKYRNAKYMQQSGEGKSDKKANEINVAQIDIKTSIQIQDALKQQLEVQKCLHEQLEIQKHLQLRIEEQGQQLKKMFDEQQKTAKSLLESKNSNIKSPTSTSNSQALASENSDNMVFPTKIS